MVTRTADANRRAGNSPLWFRRPKVVMAKVKTVHWTCLKCQYTWPADNGPQGGCPACGNLYCKPGVSP